LRETRNRSPELKKKVGWKAGGEPGSQEKGVFTSLREEKNSKRAGGLNPEEE